ncbi:MAG: DEAD/DEAH box helicase [Lawsonibacter sp.]|jgi:ATP-dependent RNA helicase RhlE
MTFRDLGLSAPILNALDELGYQAPSPIQTKAIPPALVGRDVLGCAQTGTGKTCAFAAPILQRLSATPSPDHPIRALILTPTRELAIQIGESFTAYGKHLNLRHTVIFGGVGQNPQVDALGRGVDILVATPGRLMDLYNQKVLTLNQLEIFVLDEADRMLDMGFIHDVKKILKWLPTKKQTMLFSATMPDEIAQLANSLLRNPVHVAVNPISSPVEAIEQSLYYVDKENKTKLLALLLGQKHAKSALVFTRTKHGANKVARDLEKMGISAAAIHGNKSQSARQQALANFKSGKLRCLVATDIAARGLDIEELALVFNYNLPEVPETYVHRIGRTGRAGRGGQAIAFCDFTEQPLLKEIERLLGRKIPVVNQHPYPMVVRETAKKDKNGRILHAEDVEARDAAKQQHRQRKTRPSSSSNVSPAPLFGNSSTPPAKLPGKQPLLKQARKHSSTPPVTVSAVSKQEPVLQKAPSQPVSHNAQMKNAPRERPKLTRSGKLMDTGTALPNTDFYRPNPLDSDVILDATARLLAPRKAPLASTPSRGKSTTTSLPRSGKKKKAAGPSAQQKQPPSAPPQPHPQSLRGSRQAAGKSPQEHRRTPPSLQKRGKTERRPISNAYSSKPKDSTEQPSLMKPYYLDLDR